MPEPGVPVQVFGDALGLVVTNHGRIEQTFHTVHHEPYVPQEAPALPAHWVERSAWADRAEAALRARRSVALVGMGGVGKSTLAACVAARVADLFPRGCAWIDAGSHDLDDALLRIAFAFGADISALKSREARAQAVRSRLAGQPMLLVLDNVWTDDDLASFLPVPRGSGLLLTTRNDALAAKGVDTVLTLDTLDPPDAVALLARAGEVAADDPALPRIATTLGGLPMALELAARLGRQQAARGGPFTWGGLADDLGDARQRLGLRLGKDSVQLMFDATWQRGLDDAARRAFALLGLFEPGDIGTAEAAAAWGLDASAARRQVDALLDLSLARWASPTSLYLHPLTADAAAARAGELDDALRRIAHQRVADHHFDAAPAAPLTPAALAQVLRSHRHAALAGDAERAARVWPWFDRGGSGRAVSIPGELGARGLVARRLVHERLQHTLAAEAGAVVRAWADYRLADALQTAGLPDEALAHANRAVAALDAPGADPDEQALGLSKFLLKSGQLHKQLGQWQEAEQAFRRAHAFDAALAQAGGVLGAQDGALIALLQLADLQTADADAAVWQQGVDTIYSVFEEARQAGLALTTWMAVTRMAEVLAPRSAGEAAEWLAVAWQVEDVASHALAGGLGATYASRLAAVASELALLGELEPREALYGLTLALRMARAAGSATETCRALHALGEHFVRLGRIGIAPPWAAAWAAYHLADEVVKGVDFAYPNIGAENIEKVIRPRLPADQCDTVAATVAADAWQVLADAVAPLGIAPAPSAD